MKSFLTVMICLSFVLMKSWAFADLPEPKGKSANPNVVAGDEAIDSNAYKTAVGKWNTQVQ